MEELITISRAEYEGLQKLIQQLKEEIALLKGGCDSRTGYISPSQDTGRSNGNSFANQAGKARAAKPATKGIVYP
jgi:hypothetical protein